MQATNKKKMSTQTMVLGAMLTALVVVLQLIGGGIKVGPFSFSLVLIPIVIGAAVCGVGVATWLGFVFGLVVLFGGDAAAFLAVNVYGTIATVLLKGMLCGLCSALVFKALEKKNRYLAVLAAAITCPVVNTGVFLLGCVVFFFETIVGWGEAMGFANAATYLIVGMVGINFLVEVGTDIILSPLVVRLLDIWGKNRQRKKI